MYEKEYLMLPGPAPVPPRVLRAMSAPTINHRGPAFKAVLEEVLDGVKFVCQTKSDVIALPCSGTGGMEAAVVNFINRGDKVLVLSIGAFGDRFANIAKTYGAVVDKVDFEWGTAADPNVVREKLAQDKNHEYKAVLVTHNETSTAVFNDIKAIKEAMGDHPALIIIDSVSGLGVHPLPFDEWGLDVVVAGAQKAFMVPPGVAFVAVSQKAWKVYEKNTNSKFYFDLGRELSFNKQGQTHTTPAIPQFFGLKESLKIFRERGLDAMFAQYEMFREMVRTSCRAIGLELFCADDVASAAVTAVKSPIEDGKKVNKLLRERYNVVVAGGQRDLEGKLFRIGHLGYIQPLDIIATIAALEMALTDLGFKVELGSGVAAAQKVWMERR